MGRGIRWAVHAVFVAALVALFVLQAIRGSGAPGWLLVAAAVALGAAAAELYLRVPAARLALTVLAPAPLLFLALFLFNSDVSRLSLSTETAQAAGERPRAPVVLIAFDELPVNSLLDAHGRIDPVRFPNFARLARGSTWFEHATTVGEGTTHAIPAILTGRFPKAGEFPVYTDHRQNLFTLFGGGAAPSRRRSGDAPLPAVALLGARGLARPPHDDARRGHRRRLPARAAPRRPDGRDPVDRERLGQLPPGREQAQRPRPDRPGLPRVAAASAPRRRSGTST